MTKHSDIPTCPECGARVPAGAEVCDLCGLPVHQPASAVLAEGEADDVRSGDPEAYPAPERAAAASSPAAVSHVFCNQCGWQNPSGARFCSRCGERLQEVAVSGPPGGRPAAPGLPAPGARPTEPEAGAAPQAVTRQVGILVGAGVLLVLALFLVTVFSKDLAARRPAAGPAAGAEAGAPAASPPASSSQAPLPPGVAQQVAALQEEIEGLEGEAKVAKQRELVNLFLGSGRIDRAAVTQEAIAQTVDTPEAWTEAGNYFYGWMDAAEGTEKVEAGQRAIAAYQKVLALEPENLDVRTDLATAYLGTNNPMEGVNQIKQVLAMNPDHVQANFNYGVMLMMINRVDQAVAQFEKVKTLVPRESPEYRRADEAIQQIQRSTTS